MPFPETHVFIPEESPPGSWKIQTIVFDISQERDKGYDVTIGVGKAFVGTLDASVSGLVWTTIAALGASGQGAIADHYNWVRLDITGAGAPGTDTRITVSGLA